jgi:hypothetical protein
MVREARSEFVLGVSGVGFGSALAIRGTVHGNPLFVILGLGLLAVVVTTEAAVARKGPLTRWARASQSTPRRGVRGLAGCFRSLSPRGRSAQQFDASYLQATAIGLAVSISL